MIPEWIYWLREYNFQQPRNNAITLEDNILSFNLRPDDKRIGNKKRCEISRLIKEVVGAERVYYSSFRLPQSWEWVDTNINVTTWHDDNNDNTTRSPLLISIDGRDMRIIQNTEQHHPFGKVELYRAPVQRGVWNDLKVEVKWHYNKNAYLKIHRDGVLIIDQKSKNCTGLGDYVAYMKAGLYVPDDSAEWNPVSIDFRRIEVLHENRP